MGAHANQFRPLSDTVAILFSCEIIVLIASVLNLVLIQQYEHLTEMLCLEYGLASVTHHSDGLNNGAGLHVQCIFYA